MRRKTIGHGMETASSGSGACSLAGCWSRGEVCRGQSRRLGYTRRQLQQRRPLCSEIDGPWATLMDDLQASGLWEETVVVWMGEFGRTPQINGNTGRDHFPQITPVVLGGGGIRGGVTVGRTDKNGLSIEDGKVTVPDLFATLLKALGLDPDYEFRTEFGAIAPASDHGKVISALL